MTLLVISPDYLSHYRPLSVVGSAARDDGRRVVVATGPGLRARVEQDGFVWRSLRLGASSNAGTADMSPAIGRFLAATRAGAAATIRLQAIDRERDLLWEPERVARDIAHLVDDLDPDDVLVDHVSFGSTLGMYATGRPFTTLVPGHPSQLPVGSERYGIPAAWPVRLRPLMDERAELIALGDRVSHSFTLRWNEALEAVAPDRPPVADAFRVHGSRVLFNSPAELHPVGRTGSLPPDSHFVGPLVVDQELPTELAAWAESDGRPRVYVALGTFLSHRGDVLGRITEALRRSDARAAVALGPTPVGEVGPVPADWIVAPHLPQVALLRHADVAVHHGGNNSVQESLAAGAAQVVLPFSTDQFANAADLERTRRGIVVDPNLATAAEIADAIAWARSSAVTSVASRLDPDRLVAAAFDTATIDAPLAAV